LVAALAMALAATGVAVATSSTANAAPQDVTSGGLDWGVKESFRTYITGPIASGTITLGGGATQNGNGTFHFPAASGSSFDGAAATPTATFSGSVHFEGHDGLLDMTFSNLRVVRNGSAGVLVADVVAVPFESTTATEPPPAVTYTGVELAALSGGSYATDATSASWSGASSSLTTAGVPAFGGFYPAATALDPVTYSLVLAEDEPDPDPEPDEGVLTWKLSQQAWTSSSLAPAHAAGTPATLTTDGWVFPSSATAYDPDTGATSLDLDGSLTIGNINQGGYRIVLAEPSIEVGTDGVGALEADVSYCTGSAGTQPCAGGNSTPVRAVVVTFSLAAGAVTDSGDHVSWTVTPDYPLQNDPSFPARRQFPQSFIDVLAPASPSLIGHFRDTGSGTDANKPPAPLVVSFDYEPDVDPPAGVSQQISTEVLVNGGLTISVADDTVVLPSPTLSPDGQSLVTGGALNEVTVADLRLANPGWTVSGQLTDFTSAAGTLGGEHLGWAPDVVSQDASQNVTAGDLVAAGVGDGLTASSELGSAPAGAGRGTAVLGADLDLVAPTDTPPGVYTATLTLTVI
jgi:hypothetical protein